MSRMNYNGVIKLIFHITVSIYISNSYAQTHGFSSSNYAAQGSLGSISHNGVSDYSSYELRGYNTAVENYPGSTSISNTDYDNKWSFPNRSIQSQRKYSEYKNHLSNYDSINNDTRSKSGSASETGEVKPKKISAEDLRIQTLEKKSAEGDINSKILLGDYYKLEKKEPIRALELYESAADAGNVSAQLATADMYWNGTGTDVDYNLAYFWWERAAKNGNTDAKNAIGQFYYYGVDKPKPNYKEAEAWYKKAALDGDAKANYLLGKMYQDGLLEGTENEAFRYFSTAAGSGYIPAYTSLGETYWEVGQYTLAIAQYRKAADFADVTAQVHLGDAYAHGTGVANTDLEQARIWYLSAAKGGSDEGATKAAKMLLNAEGGPRSPQQAIQLLEQSVTNNYAPAMLELGGIYEKGEDVIENKLLALELYENAATQDLPKSVHEHERLLREICEKEGELEGCEPITIFFMTDRKDTKSSNPEKRFGNIEDPDGGKVHFGIVHVSVPRKLREEQKLQREKHYGIFGRSYDFSDIRPFDTRVSNMQIDVLDANVFFSHYEDVIEENRSSKNIHQPSLLFVHGFNNSFSEAAYRLAKLARRINYRGPLLMYSWPSVESASGYGADQDEYDISCPKLSEQLKRLHSSSPAQPINILAHSLGTRLVFDIFTGGVNSNCENPNIKLRDIVFAAPDIYTKKFKNNRELFINNMDRLSLYVSSNDLALSWQSLLWRKHRPRLGEGGDRRYVVNGLDTMDASSLNTGLISHAYVFEHGHVIFDIEQLLIDNIEPSSRRYLTVQDQQGAPYFMVH